tara:strand:- start:4409 stop:4591 length:183 start_codon:yes stop_codon:yes gene_type:complete
MDAADHIAIGHIGVDHTVMGSGDLFKQITLALVLVSKAFIATGDALQAPGIAVAVARCDG